MYLLHFVIYSSIGRHLCSLCVLASVNSAASNMGVHILTFVFVSSLLFCIASPFMCVSEMIQLLCLLNSRHNLCCARIEYCSDVRGRHLGEDDIDEIAGS